MKFVNLVDNTEPLILHVNGKNRTIAQDERFYKPIIESGAVNIPPNLSILTCATTDPDLLSKSPLVKQLEYNNIDYTNVGKNHKGAWKNLLKLKYLVEYFNSTSIGTDYVCFLDSADVLLSEDFNTILDRFTKLNLDLLWGSQMYNWPQSRNNLKPTELEKSRSKYINRFLCSGVAIGKTKVFEKFIRIAYEDIDYETNIWNSDQYEIKKTFNRLYSTLNIDYDFTSNISYSPALFYINNKLLYSQEGNKLIFKKNNL